MHVAGAQPFCLPRTSTGGAIGVSGEGVHVHCLQDFVGKGLKKVTTDSEVD